VIIRRLT